MIKSFARRRGSAMHTAILDAWVNTKARSGRENGYALVRPILGCWREVLARSANRWGTSPVTGDGDVVVSMTSYGRRVDRCFLAIESIAAGTIRPRRLILWLDDPEQASRLPVHINRLVRRGLEVRLTSNYGPHTKYYPFLVDSSNDPGPLVTADDDILYSRQWLAQLLATHRDFPNDIVCHRTKDIGLVDANLAPYQTWKDCTDTTGRIGTFVTGVSGVLYPHGFLTWLAAAGDAFVQCAPKADDVWLSVSALRAKRAVRQVRSMSILYPFVSGTQDSGLLHANAYGGANDAQIKKTYGPADIQLLLEMSSRGANE